MKLAIDCRFFGKSGVGSYLDGIVRELLSQHSEHEYLLVCNKDEEWLHHGDNVEVLIKPLNTFSVKEMLCYPVGKINKCDAFFTPNMNVPLGIRVPKFCTIHDVVFWDMPELISRRGLWVRTLFLKHALRSSRSIFTDSFFSRERIIHHFGFADKIKVVGCGVNQQLKDYAISNNCYKKSIILYVGNVKPHKGLRTLLTAYKMAKAEGLKDELYIVGEKDNFRTGDASVMDEFGTIEGLCFTGRISNESLYNFMMSARVLVLPTRYEGFGLPPMEALYLGTNAIVSDIPVMKEIYSDFPVTFFKDGDAADLAGKLLALEDKIEDVVELREQIDLKYSYKKTAQEIINVINSLI